MVPAVDSWRLVTVRRLAIEMRCNNTALRTYYVTMAVPFTYSGCVLGLYVRVSKGQIDVLGMRTQGF